MYSKKLYNLSWKEIMFSKRMRKWAFWFIVAFLAALTIKDVISLVSLHKIVITYVQTLSKYIDNRIF